MADELELSLNTLPMKDKLKMSPGFRSLSTLVMASVADG